MSEPLRVLLVEDCEDDALLLMRELKQGGFAPVFERVETPGEMRAALEKGAWDIVLADHKLPSFSAPAALQLLKESGVELPFVIVSGSIGDKVAVEAMEAGASDYIMKDNPSRLVPVIRRSLQEVESRRKHNRAEEALRDSEQKFSTLFHNANDVICLYRLEPGGGPGRIVEVNQMALEKLGYSREELLRMSPLHLLPEGEREALRGHVREILINGNRTLEANFLTKRGGSIPFEVSSHMFSSQDVVAILSICRDITERKRAENELRESLDTLRSTMEGIVEMTAKTLELRDPYTAGHQRSVSKLACAIARKLSLPENEIEGIRLACEIHDLGKIYVPGEILTKPGKISTIEFDMIRTHPKVGYDILRTIEFPWPIAEMVAQHHERMDGSGYPLGLGGEEISLGARILGVADVVDAMASHRPYRPALGIEKALAEIVQNKYKFYDPNVVEACLSLIKEKEFILHDCNDPSTP